MHSQLTPQEALIYAMVTVAAVDRQITRVELDRINGMVRELPALRGIEDSWLSNEAQSLRTNSCQAGRRHDRRRDDRRGAAIRTCARPRTRWRPRSAASDLAIKDDERDFLELLANALQLDPLVRVALDYSANARHRTA